jgi:hypothetical protein
MPRVTSSSFACEDCGAVRADEPGWVRVWLDENYQPPTMLIYCASCARQFGAYPDEVFLIDCEPAFPVG